MHKWLWFSALLVVFGVSVLAHVPSRLVVPEQIGPLRFLGIGGSVWRGEIEQILYSGKPLPVRNLNWKVRPTALLGGTLKADFKERQTPVNRGQMVVHLLSRQVEVQALHWALPGSSLDPWFRAGVILEGQFVLDLEILRLPEHGLLPGRVQGRLDWRNAALRFDSEYWPIGSPVMQFSGEGDAVKGVVTNSQPQLPGDSSFQCTPERCRVELNLKPTADAPPSLANILLLLGLEQAGNRFSGRITLPLE